MSITEGLRLDCMAWKLELDPRDRLLRKTRLASFGLDSEKFIKAWQNDFTSLIVTLLRTEYYKNSLEYLLYKLRLQYCKV